MRTLAATGALLALVCPGCGDGPVQSCDAIDLHDALIIHAPVGDVLSISADGACKGSRIRCIPRNYDDPNPFVPGCALYQIEPASLGICRLTVALKDAASARFALTIQTNIGCNDSPYLGTAPDAGDITITDGDAGRD